MELDRGIDIDIRAAFEPEHTQADLTCLIVDAWRAHLGSKHRRSFPARWIELEECRSCSSQANGTRRSGRA